MRMRTDILTRSRGKVHTMGLQHAEIVYIYAILKQEDKHERQLSTFNPERAQDC